MGVRARVKSLFKRVWWFLFGAEDNPSNVARPSTEDVGPQLMRESESKAIEFQLDVSGYSPLTLSCDTYEVSVDAEIDYVDKSGKFSRREITTDQIFDYEDGVQVIRAFCHRRKDYRTFVSKRIQHWKDIHSGRLIRTEDLSQYLRRKSDSDPSNTASNIFNSFIHEVYLAIDVLMRFSGNQSTPKDRISGKKRNSLVEWILKQEEAQRFLRNIDVSATHETYEQLKKLISDSRVTRPVYLSSVSVLRKASDERKQCLITFASQCLESLPEHDSAIAVLKDELLHPSFPINTYKETSIEEKQEEITVQDFAEARSRVASSQKKYRKSKKQQARSTAYRYYERNDPVRICALKEAQLQIGIKQLDGDYVFDREEFELKIRQKLLNLMSKEDLEDQGEMFMRRLGSGIALAYLTFGLKKKNRGWYVGPNGRCVIDLRNASAD